MKEYEPMKDNDTVYGWVCGYCAYPIAFSQKCCEECGNKVDWTVFMDETGGEKKGGQNMDDLYAYMNKKLDEMHENNSATISIGFAEFARLFQLVCMMKQIRTIANV